MTFWEQVAVHEQRGIPTPVAMRAARIILLERRDPAHRAFDELLHPRNRVGEFTIADILRDKRGRIPALTGRQLHRILRRAGFQRTGMRGSHAIFKHPEGGRQVVVPMHTGSIPRGTLSHILSVAAV